jgi:hypothetical protein
MLTDKDKEYIQLEENYRHEVREQFRKRNPARTRWERVSPILNSAFVLWFLSSVVLGIVGVAYTKWDAKRTIEREKREREAQVKRENELVTRKLDAEIENRLIFFARINHLELDAERSRIIIGFNSEDDVERIKKSLIELENPSVGEHKLIVFPEYANRNLRSLLFELKEVIPDEQKSEVENAYNKSLVVTEFYLSETGRNQDAHSKNRPESTFALTPERSRYLVEMSVALNLKRWNEPFSWDRTSK